jgi:hypothetical protein
MTRDEAFHAFRAWVVEALDEMAQAAMDSEESPEISTDDFIMPTMSDFAAQFDTAIAANRGYAARLPHPKTGGVGGPWGFKGVALSKPADPEPMEL